MSDAVEALKRRKVRRVAYLHTDHFEPWRDGVSQAHCDEVHKFGEQMDALPYAKKLTLFYRAHIPYGVNSNGYKISLDNRVSRPDDPIVFRARTDEENTLSRNTIQALLKNRAYEMQVHVHHEGYTMSEKLYPQVREVLEGYTTPDRDEDRFEMALQLALKAIRSETGLPMKRWAFVHGNWALAASDPDICRIEGELEILARNGCYADFTFPAGRSHCNPEIDGPFAVTPVSAERAFDAPAANAKALGEATHTLGKDRFMIWNSPVKHPFSSLDTYSRHAFEVFNEADATVLRWIEESPMLGSTLYVKTHAHSLYKAYWDEKHDGDGVAALARPGPRKVMDKFVEAVARAGVKFDPVTAEETYLEWLTADQAKEDSELMKTARGIFGLKRKSAELSPVRSAPLIGGPRSADLVIPTEDRPTREALNAEMLQAFQTRIETMGEKESGAYGYYAARVEKGDVLYQREWALANKIHDVAADATIHEIGPGAATLAIACASLGHSCVGLERDARRAGAAAALTQACGAVDAEIPKRLRILNERFPSDLLDGLRKKARRSLVATTNFISSTPESQEAALIESVGRYDIAVIDLCSFRVRRNDEAERADLRDRILAAGFSSA